MKRCAKCQAEIPADSRFCVACGAPAPGDEEPTAAVTQSGEKSQYEMTEMIDTGEQKTAMIDGAASPPSAADASVSTGTDEETTPSTGSQYDISKIFETSGVCPNCYAPLQKGSDHCDECGYTLSRPESAEKTMVTPPPVTAAPAEPTPPAGVAATPPSPPPVEPPIQPTVQPVITPPPPVAPTTAKKGGRRMGPVLIILGIGLVLVIVLAIGGWYIWQNYLAPREAGGTMTESATTESVPETTPAAVGEDHAARAREYQQLGQWDKAEQEWNAYLAAHPKDMQPHLELARIDSARQDYPQALQQVQTYLAENGGDGAAHALAGQLQMKLGRDEEAIQSYLTALSLDPDNAAWLLELGKAYIRTGYADKAIVQLRDVKRLEPEQEEARMLLAQQLFQTGQKNEAAQVARQYLDTFPAGVYRDGIQDILNQAEGARSTAATRPAETRPSSSTASQPSSGGTTTTSRPASDQHRETQTQSTSPPKQEAAPSQPSPFVSVEVDGSALNLPGKYCEVSVSFGGIQQKFNSAANMRIDNVKRGVYPYNVTVIYFLSATNERDRVYSGSGTVNIRYPDQKLTLRLVGNRVLMQ